MLRHFAVVVLLLPLALLAGCQAGAHASSSTGVQARGDSPAGRAQGYALLYSTLSDDAEVDKVLILKSPEVRVVNLIKAIANFCGEAKTRLEAFAQADPSINLKDPGLPSLELKAREVIGSTTSKQILFGTGKQLEFRLLLTQHEALNYITHLAGVLADAETNQSRKTYLEHMAQTSASLHEQVLTLMMTPYTGAAAK